MVHRLYRRSAVVVMMVEATAVETVQLVPGALFRPILATRVPLNPLKMNSRRRSP